MKIKHFAGYGSVNAKKISKEQFEDEWGEKKTRLVIRVWGNHECGIERNDEYDIFNWLVKRFDKDCTDYRMIENMTTNDRYEEIGNLDVEVCDYIIVYNKSKYPFFM